MDYIHGYSNQEQIRLIQQAEYWREDLILKGLNYQPGESLLEIGCGAGAVLQILGIDLEPKQIEYAKNHLNNLNLDADLKVGDAIALPWNGSQFEHIYAIWFLEHLLAPQQVLKEAQRVLKPGGTITLTETDYRTILVYPESKDYRYLIDSLCELLLQAQGNPYIGQSLGTLLKESGFDKIDNQPIPIHHAYSLNKSKLNGFIEYVDSWLAPTVEKAIVKLGKNADRLNAGLDWFRSIPYRHNGAVSATIYRASAIKYHSKILANKNAIGEA